MRRLAGQRVPPGGFWKIFRNADFNAT